MNRILITSFFATVAVIASSEAYAISTATLNSADGQQKMDDKIKQAGKEITDATRANAKVLKDAGQPINLINLDRVAVGGPVVVALLAIGIIPGTAQEQAAAIALLNTNPTDYNSITLVNLTAVQRATAVDSPTRDTMAWAINNGFAGEPAGTIPAGIATYVNTTCGGNHRYLIKTQTLGNFLDGSLQGRVLDNKFIISSDNIDALAHAVAGSYIVFTAIAPDGNYFVTVTNAANAP